MKAVPPPRLLLPAIAIVSACALAYEILLMRLLSIIHWHHFAYMVISLALLGYGASGALIALCHSTLQRWFCAGFITSSTLFGLSALCCFMIAQTLPFNALEVVWDHRQWLYLLGLYLLFFLPFLCAATCIGMALTIYRPYIGRIYFADLIGAGLGALVIILALYLCRPETCLLGISLMSLLAGLLLLPRVAGRRLKRALAAAIIGIAATLLVAQQVLSLHQSPYKSLGQTLAIMDSELLEERSSPLGLISVVASPSVPFRYAPGLSFNSSSEPPEQIGLFTDGDSFTPINRHRAGDDSATYLQESMIALPYQLSRPAQVLILGAGGGSGVLAALSLGAQQIDAVELNPDVADLVSNRFSDFAGGLYHALPVTLHIAEARGFVARTNDQFDLIQVTMLDSLAASGSGIHGLSESYLYTVEALQEYLRHLRPQGVLAIDRWLQLPPRDGLKLVATAIDALRALGVADPDQRLVLVRSWNSITLLVKNGAWHKGQLNALRQFTRRYAFDVSYYPGISAQETNRYNRLDRPYFYEGVLALLSPQADQYVRDYKFQIAPATDDRPYFFHFFRWHSLPELLRLSRSGGAALMEWGYLILIATLVQALMLGALLILVPLWYTQRQRKQQAKTGKKLLRSGYFLALGFAFIFVEIAFIQKFVLFLSYPLYAIAVVLSGFLVFAGIGSGLSGFLARYCTVRGRQPITIAVLGIVLITAIYLVLLPPLFDAYLGASDRFRILLTLGLIAPLACCMGMPFPLGLSRLTEQTAGFIPWAWGLNGFASVVAAVAATAIAIELGFKGLLLLALGLYLMAWRWYRFV